MPLSTTQNPRAIKRRASLDKRKQHIPRGKYWMPNKPGPPGKRLPAMPKSNFLAIRRRNIMLRLQEHTPAKLPWFVGLAARAQARQEYANYKAVYREYVQRMAANALHRRRG